MASSLSINQLKKRLDTNLEKFKRAERAIARDQYKILLMQKKAQPESTKAHEEKPIEAIEEKSVELKTKEPIKKKSLLMSIFSDEEEN